MSKYLSMRKGEIRDVEDSLAEKLIADGVAEQYNLIEPTGKITITENGSDIDVAQYAKADVNVSGSLTTDSILTIASANLSSVNIEYAGIVDGKVDLIGLTNAGAVNTFQFLIGKIYPTSQNGLKVTISNPSNVQYAEVAQPNGSVGTSKGVIFWTYGEAASMTVGTASL